MWRAFRTGRLIVTLLLVIAGSLIWIYQWINNALNYTEVAAQVVQIENVCAPVGAPKEEAMTCEPGAKQAGGKRLIWYRLLHLRYKSPADSAEHVTRMILTNGKKSADENRLRAGDNWKILARNDDPLAIKPR